MIEPARFLDHCREQGVTFYTGVPDSLLKQLNAQILATVPRERHVIAANEGAAVGIAIGHYLRTGTLAAVYLQNSGYGNLVNPLLSLADPDVYGVPMLIIIGWRGQAGVKDEPQHVKQGRVMAPLLDATELPWARAAEGSGRGGAVRQAGGGDRAGALLPLRADGGEGHLRRADRQAGGAGHRWPGHPGGGADRPGRRGRRRPGHRLHHRHAQPGALRVPGAHRRRRQPGLPHRGRHGARQLDRARSGDERAASARCGASTATARC